MFLSNLASLELVLTVTIMYKSAPPGSPGSVPLVPPSSSNCSSSNSSSSSKKQIAFSVDDGQTISPTMLAGMRLNLVLLVVLVVVVVIVLVLVLVLLILLLLLQ